MDPLAIRDIALTGIPRGGTTLACRLLGEAEDCLSLFEPMAVLQLPVQPDLAVRNIGTYYQAVRRRALADGLVPSKHHHGRIPDNPFGNRDRQVGVRPRQAELGEIAVGKALSPEFRLVIKHNAAFTALLPGLGEYFDVLGVVRNPLAVLASWRSLDLPVSHGRLPAAERLDNDLRRALDGEPDLLRRQILILEWFFGRLGAHVSASRLLRYEDIVASDGRALLDAAGLSSHGAGLRPLQSRNVNPQYDIAQVDIMVDALRVHGRACWSCYSLAEVEVLAAKLKGGGDG